MMENFDFDNMTQADFEERLPEIFAGQTGKVSDDPRLQTFLANHPDCAALVRDLETIAETARSLFEPVHEPGEDLWAKIQSRMTEPEEPSESGPLSLNGEPKQLVTGGTLADLE